MLLGDFETYVLFVLIETLWNVKSIYISILTLVAPSINRNIVECKVFYKRNNNIQLICINRNIVECKVVFIIFVIGVIACINRNIVECKV